MGTVFTPHFTDEETEKLNDLPKVSQPVRAGTERFEPSDLATAQAKGLRRATAPDGSVLAPSMSAVEVTLQNPVLSG